MKVVFFIDSLKKIGGGSYAQFKFAQQLARQGHEVTIFAGDKNFLSDELESENLSIFYRRSLPRRRLTKWWAKIHDRIYIAPYLRKNRPDWLIGYMRISAIKAVKFGSMFNIPVANFIFETPLWIKEEMDKKIEGSLEKLWEQARIAYNQSDILIPNSSLAGRKLLDWLPTGRVSEPVYPGVNLSEIDNRDLPRDIDIIYIGRLRKHKNVNLILENATPEMKIVIIGSGGEKEKLEEMGKLRNLNVHFAGAVTDQKKWEYLRRSKLMIFPSSFEGFGMPPLEALASGCRILCSDIPIFREVYGEEVSYFSLDSPKITAQIEKLLSSTPNEHLSELVQKYTWERSGKRIEKILGV